MAFKLKYKKSAFPFKSPLKQGDDDDMHTHTKDDIVDIENPVDEGGASWGVGFTAGAPRPDYIKTQQAEKKKRENF